MLFSSDILTSYEIFLAISNNIEHTKQTLKKALISCAKLYVFRQKVVFGL